MLALISVCGASQISWFYCITWVYWRGLGVMKCNSLFQAVRGHLAYPGEVGQCWLKQLCVCVCVCVTMYVLSMSCVSARASLVISLSLVHFLRCPLRCKCILLWSFQCIKTYLHSTMSVFISASVCDPVSSPSTACSCMNSVQCVAV